MAPPSHWTRHQIHHTPAGRQHRAQKLAARPAAMSAAPRTARARPGRMPSSRGSMGGSTGSGQPPAIGLVQLQHYRAMVSPKTATRPWLQPLRQLQPRSRPPGRGAGYAGMFTPLKAPKVEACCLPDPLESASHAMLREDTVSVRNLDNAKEVAAHVFTAHCRRPKRGKWGRAGAQWAAAQPASAHWQRQRQGGQQ